MSMLWIKSGPATELNTSPGQPTSLEHYLIAGSALSCWDQFLPKQTCSWRVRPRNDTGARESAGSGSVPDPFSFSSRLKAMDPTLMPSEGEKHFMICSDLAYHNKSWFYEMELRISKIKHTLLFFFFVHFWGNSSTMMWIKLYLFSTSSFFNHLKNILHFISKLPTCVFDR